MIVLVIKLSLFLTLLKVWRMMMYMCSTIRNCAGRGKQFRWKCPQGLCCAFAHLCPILKFHSSLQRFMEAQTQCTTQGTASTQPGGTPRRQWQCPTRREDTRLYLDTNIEKLRCCCVAKFWLRICANHLYYLTVSSLSTQKFSDPDSSQESKEEVQSGIWAKEDNKKHNRKGGCHCAFVQDFHMYSRSLLPNFLLSLTFTFYS
jgi:hypothetical protein